MHYHNIALETCEMAKTEIALTEIVMLVIEKMA